VHVKYFTKSVKERSFAVALFALLSKR